MLRILGRGERIRTSDLHVPNVAQTGRTLRFRAFALGVGAALTCMFTPAVTHGYTPPATVELFGPEAGFAKARLGPLEDRKSITVGLAPEFWSDDPMTVADRIAWLDPVLDAWNTAAGWQVFIQVTDDAVADVTFTTDAETTCPPDAGACAWMTEFDLGYFEHCYVAFWPWFPTADVAAHELGHCLGFICPGVRPLDDGYRGVMIHHREWGATPDNPHDRASLAAAGYRGTVEEP